MVGAGVIGMEYASMLGALQCMDITVVDARPTILDFVDSELVENLTFHMRENRIKFRLGEKVKCVSINHDRQQVPALLRCSFYFSVSSFAQSFRIPLCP